MIDSAISGSTTAAGAFTSPSTAIDNVMLWGEGEHRGDAEHPPEIRCADQQREEEQQMIVAGEDVLDAEADKPHQPERARRRQIDRDPP